MVTGFMLGIVSLLILALIVNHHEDRKRITALEAALVVQSDVNRRYRDAILRLGGSVTAFDAPPPRASTIATRGPRRPQ